MPRDYDPFVPEEEEYTTALGYNNLTGEHCEMRVLKSTLAKKVHSNFARMMTRSAFQDAKRKRRMGR